MRRGIGASQVTHHQDGPRGPAGAHCGRIGDRFSGRQSDAVHSRVDLERERPGLRRAIGLPRGDILQGTGDRNEIGGGMEGGTAGEIAVQNEDPGIRREPAGLDALRGKGHEEVPAALGVEGGHDGLHAEPVAVCLDDAGGTGGRATLRERAPVAPQGGEVDGETSPGAGLLGAGVVRHALHTHSAALRTAVLCDLLLLFVRVL